MLYDVIETGVSPGAIDNTNLLCTRPTQANTANCMVISACNIVEAKYWQLTGIKIKFVYDTIFNMLTKDSDGLNFNDMNKILSLISKTVIVCSSPLSVHKFMCPNEDVMTEYLKAAIHKYQFATIGITPIKSICDSNHALTVCGYNTNGFIVQTTYATSPRFDVIDFLTLFDAFVNFQCINVHNLVTD